METNIQKWGNSLGVRLPKQLTEKKSLHPGTRVLVTETKDGLAIAVAKETSSYTLTSLLKKVSDDNQPKNIDWGQAVGNEIW